MASKQQPSTQKFSYARALASSQANKNNAQNAPAKSGAAAAKPVKKVEKVEKAEKNTEKAPVSKNDTAERQSQQQGAPAASEKKSSHQTGPTHKTTAPRKPAVSSVPIQFGSITKNATIPVAVPTNMASKSANAAPAPAPAPAAPKDKQEDKPEEKPEPKTEAGAPVEPAAAPAAAPAPTADSPAASAAKPNAPAENTHNSYDKPRQFSDRRHFDRYNNNGNNGNSNYNNNNNNSYNKHSNYHPHGYGGYNNGSGPHKNNGGQYRNRRGSSNAQMTYPSFGSNTRASMNHRNAPQGVAAGASMQIPVSLQSSYGQLYGQPPYIIDPNMVQYSPMIQPGYVGQYYPVFPQNPYAQPYQAMTRTPSQVSDPMHNSNNGSMNSSPHSASVPIVKQQKKSSALKIVNPVTHTEVVVPQKVKSNKPADQQNAKPEAAPVRHQLTEEEASQRKNAIKIAVQQRIQEKEAEAKRLAEEKAKREAEEKAKREAEEQAKREAEEKAKREAEEKARREAEEQAKREAEEKAKREAEEQAKREAEEKAKREAEEKAKREAEEQAKREAEEKAKREAEEQAKREAEEKAKREAEEKAKREAEEKAKLEAEEKAKLEAEEKAKREAEEKAKREAEEKAKSETAAATAASAAEAAVTKSPKTDSDRSSAPVESPRTTPLSEGKRLRETLLASSPSRFDPTARPSSPQSEAAIKCLASAKYIEDFTQISYPANIKPPSSSIGQIPGKYIYDIPFLLQFQNYYTDKPTLDWTEKMKETIGNAFTEKGSRGFGSSRQGSRSGSTHSHGGNAGFNMEHKSMSRLALERGFGSSNMSFGSGSNYKSASRMGHGHGGMNGSRRGSQRGSRRGDRKEPEMTIPLEQVAPLKLSANRWQPKREAEKAVLERATENELIPLDVIQRKVKAALNKMTLEKFDKISDQILEFAMQSRMEKDGKTLKTVIQLTFEKATDEPNFSNMYARLARKMMDNMDEGIVDENVLDKNSQPVRGGLLFRKYLLSRCQEDFERGWKASLPSGGVAEAELMSDEYYVAAAIKRRGLGLVRFIGELFKLSMLSEKIMHECIKRLLGNVTDPEEEEVESLCKLLMTVGANIDATEKGRAAMDVYVQRMEMITKVENLPSRIKFIILDVIDSRKAGWRIKNEIEKGPKTIAEIHEEAERKRALQESQRANSRHGRDMNRNDSHSRRGNNYGNNDWSNNKDGYARLGQGIRGLKSGSHGSHGPTSFSSMMRGGSGNRSSSNQSSSLRREATSRAPAASAPVTTANSFELLEEQDHDAGNHDSEGNSSQRDPNSSSKASA
ncbi:translation initiation factor eIF4G [Schizosaccharomyces japonicus yFS275]|uniref:Translation initiation factor eIF4G n=1 Tax=Schizosaccharomyces japonicus (strain yFS275 / FY16936) TaxID=402676 RepID=B6JZC5_SCHJY|nr:translation initiation factor eIF4G [Schizosaccharomyces japonicus yFS275]EEB06893.1 translation initiation factor eIF4G [Schizosaccharomyces japonicus yFS275]